MTISTCFQYLLGQRRAILEIAETKSAVWLGLLLVVSAGFAREYDGEDLLHEPWHLALPLVASLATSFILFCVLLMASSNNDSPGASFLRTYRMFLGLYWMTAPLAWLYALPVERFLSAADATSVNLWLLGIVAVWRVVLMTRVIAVVFESTFLRVFLHVMLFADTVVLVLLFLTPLPVMSLMGGIRHTESEILIQGTAFLIGLLGIISWPIWLIGALMMVAAGRGLSWIPAASLASGRSVSPTAREVELSPALPPTEPEQQARRHVSRSAWTVGIVSVLIWLPVLPLAQPEQQLRRTVEKDLRGDRIDRALATMSRHERSDFPPHWDPPPRIGYGEQHPPILEVVEAVLANDTKRWVSDMFLSKLSQSVGRGYAARDFFIRLDSEQFDRFLSVLERSPDSSSFIEDHREALSKQMEEHSERTPAQQARVRALLGMKQKGDAALFRPVFVWYSLGMPRRPRICPAGVCFHVLNRAVARLTMFEKQADYEAFERVLVEAVEREPLPIFTYCVMPNHWHFVVRPTTDRQLTDFFRWLTHTHTMRWHAHHKTQGTGHLYQGRFKAFPIEQDKHLLAVLRYVERNPVRAGRCTQAEDWRFGSAWRNIHGDRDARELLASWPIPRPRQWRSFVNEPQTEAEMKVIRSSVNRGTPYGSEGWLTQSATRLHLTHTLRLPGRPKKVKLQEK